MCIDYQRRGYINAEQWNEFISAIYQGKHEKRKVEILFEMLDERNIGYMVSYFKYLNFRIVKHSFKAVSWSIQLKESVSPLTNLLSESSPES